MVETKKQYSELDQQQLFKKAYNQEAATLGIDGFVAGMVGRKIERSLTTTTVANDTEVFSFSENGTLLYTLNVVYTDDSLGTLLSVERTA